MNNKSLTLWRRILRIVYGSAAILVGIVICGISIKLGLEFGFDIPSGWSRGQLEGGAWPVILAIGVGLIVHGSFVLWQNW